MDQRRVSAAELPERLSALLASLREAGDTVVVDGDGAIVATLLSLRPGDDELIAMLEDIEDEHDEELARELEATRAAIARGEWVDFRDVVASWEAGDVLDSTRGAAD